MKTKVTLIAIVVFAMSLVVGVVTAQDDELGLRGLRAVGSSIVEIVSDATGLTNQEIVEQLRDGATLAEIIATTDANLETIMADVEEHLIALIETALENERISQERADALLENLPETIDTIFNTSPDFGNRGFDRNRVGAVFFANLLQAIMDETDLTLPEIVAQVSDGTTLSEILEANGADANVIVDAVITDVTAAVNERVDNGDLSQEQAVTLLETLEQNLMDWLNGESPLPFGGRGNGHRPR